jgi:hypothetical protein
MESWGANGVIAARYAGQRARVGPGTPGRRVRGTALLAACIAVATLLGSLALGSNTAPSDASRPGNDAPASVFAAPPGEPARIPALDEGPAGFSAGPDRPLDRKLSGEPAGAGGLTVDVRRALEQIASEG